MSTPLDRFEMFLKEHGCTHALGLLRQHQDQLSQIKSLDGAIAEFIRTVEASENPSPSI